MLKNKINGKIYIGQTIRPIEKRFQQHQQKGNGCVAIYRAIQKYGWENFEKDYYECPNEDLNFDEELLVREMGTLSPDGYNLKEGGGATGKLSKETKRKMSESHIGVSKSEEHKRNMRKPKSEGHKQKMSERQLGEKNHMFGKTLNEEHKRKISEANIGKIHTDGSKQKMSEALLGEKNHMSKRVYQYDLDGNLLGSFGSCGEAARNLEKDRPNISACASGKCKTAYGFKWSYSIIESK